MTMAWSTLGARLAQKAWRIRGLDEAKPCSNGCRPQRFSESSFADTSSSVETPNGVRARSAR